MEQEIRWAEWLTYYLIAINFLTFLAYGLDKTFAEKGLWRISEANLHTLAIIGGTPGAYAGRALFRHKTRKRDFSNVLHAIAGLQIAIILAGTLMGWGTLFEMLGNLLRR